ncbi:PEP-CTERM sorting domain-containing protein [Paucibacter sp. R3-3]|uniref:PEP-CTERM sorting domain-containing protein n=1 Tax=Roseateles agri TaxID=3098619 RepID=A0ABU5DT38_9BURK|nr:PEP-CTERM sorting domain-containing protein [Paucibacter sp. R3-3]MDY0749073.1 PEP-CTERM sorting domain-containing protein [Paucibacter sp. R3-3]
MKTLRYTAALALSLTVVAGPCRADSSASGTLGNVHITLTDLDPNDGINPSLTINFGSQPFLNSAIGSYGPDFEQDAFSHLGKNASSTVNDSLQAPLSTSSATMVGANTVAGITSMLVSGSASSNSLGYGEFGALAANYTSTNFTLSPHTAITITVDATLNVQTTIGYDPVSGTGEFASSHALLVLDGHDIDGILIRSQAYQPLYVDAAMDAYGNFTGAQQSWAGTLSVTYSNTSSQDLLGAFYGELDAGGSSIATPVPEPDSYALLAAGLGVMVWMTRRRKAQSLKRNA